MRGRARAGELATGEHTGETEECAAAAKRTSDEVVAVGGASGWRRSHGQRRAELHIGREAKICGPEWEEALAGTQGTGKLR
jgi:hypothetical protein